MTNTHTHTKHTQHTRNHLTHPTNHHNTPQPTRNSLPVMPPPGYTYTLHRCQHQHRTCHRPSPPRHHHNTITFTHHLHTTTFTHHHLSHHHLHTITSTPSPSHDHLHTISSTPSPPQHHLHTITFTPPPPSPPLPRSVSARPRLCALQLRGRSARVDQHVPGIQK